jgi:hypothetical protein
MTNCLLILHPGRVVFLTVLDAEVQSELQPVREIVHAVFETSEMFILEQGVRCHQELVVNLFPSEGFIKSHSSCKRNGVARVADLSEQKLN